MPLVGTFGVEERGLNVSRGELSRLMKAVGFVLLGSAAANKKRVQGQLSEWRSGLNQTNLETTSQFKTK